MVFLNMLVEAVSVEKPSSSDWPIQPLLAFSRKKNKIKDKKNP